jgi:HPt (histidine-containing phosphotransfer) domain-containing protein
MKLVNPDSFNETFQYFDKEIVVEIIDIFINEYPERMANIERAIHDQNHSDLKFHAHSIKGVIANFMVADVQELAKKLEIAGSEQNLSGVDKLFGEFKEQCKYLVDDLKEIKSQYL